jgi:hypothetical protein
MVSPFSGLFDALKLIVMLSPAKRSVEETSMESKTIG